MSDPNPVVALKRAESSRPNFTDPNHYRRITHIAFTPPDYDALQTRLDVLRDADDDDNRRKYGDGFSA